MSGGGFISDMISRIKMNNELRKSVFGERKHIYIKLKKQIHESKEVNPEDKEKALKRLEHYKKANLLRDRAITVVAILLTIVLAFLIIKFII